MNSESAVLNSFERLFLDAEFNSNPEVLREIKRLKIKCRVETGTGLLVDFADYEPTLCIAARRRIGPDLVIKVGRNKQDIGGVVWLKDGIFDRLEFFSYGEEAFPDLSCPFEIYPMA